MSSVQLAEPLTPEWFDRRRQGIGASEVAAVMGISPWESPFSLYWRKVNGWEYEPSAEMEWGNRLEDAIAAKFQDGHPDEILTPGQLVVGPEPWILATPDRVVSGLVPEELRCWRVPDEAPPATYDHAVLELKTAHSADGWGEPFSDDVPVHYRAQVQWQMLCVDVVYATIAVLIGGSDYREYTVLRDDRDLRVMVEHGRRFMARIANGDPPPIDDHAATLATVKRLHPDLDDNEVEVDSRIANHYRRACEMDRKAGALKKRYEALLRAEMGRARKATCAGQFVASRSLYEVGEHTVKAHTVDRLNPPRTKKESS
jgi:putative phage-type endonuclease